MSQHDYVIDNGTGAAVRADLNNALAAIVGCNAGATAPSTTYAYMLWADTAAGVMKQRDPTNTSWITLWTLSGMVLDDLADVDASNTSTIDGYVLTYDDGTGLWGPAESAGGVFSSIASQAEAEAGTDNTKGMTPLRTAEAIASLVSSSGADQVARDNTYLNAFRIIEQHGLGPLEMSDSLVDGYEDETGVDTGSSTDETYDSAGDYYHNPGNAGEVDYSGSSNIGDMTNAGGLAAAFDGNLDQADNVGARKLSTTSGYVGKDWGSGNTKTLTGVKVWGSNNNGYANGICDIKVYGSNSAPANATDGTLIATVATGLADVNNANMQEKLTGFVTSTAYRYHWVTLNNFGGTGASDSCYLAEVEFYETTTAANMVLVSAAITAASAPAEIRVVLDHEAVDSVTMNTDLVVAASRDGGTTWSNATMVEQADLGSGRKIWADTIDVSGQPSGTSVKYRFTVANNKEQRFHAVAVQADVNLTL